MLRMPVQASARCCTSNPAVFSVNWRIGKSEGLSLFILNRTNTEFWQKWNSNLKPGTEISKTQVSCKLNFHWYQNSQHESGTDLNWKPNFSWVFSAALKKLTARENWIFIGVEICRTRQGQTWVWEKFFLMNKCTRAMEQREAATGLSEAREAADR